MPVSKTKELAKQLGLLRKRKPTDGSGTARKRRKGQFLSHVIVIDFESTCWKDKKGAQEIIEFPAVLLDLNNGQIVSEFQQYVQPQEKPRLSDFCTELTGITQEQVDNGIPLPTCLRLFSMWLRKLREEKGMDLMEPGREYTEDMTLCALATWSDWDLGVCLNYECRRKQIRKQPHFNQWIDLRFMYKEFYDRRPAGLRGALEDLGITFTGREHCGLDDARNTAKLCYRLTKDGCKLNITKCIQNKTQAAVIKPSCIPQSAIISGFQGKGGVESHTPEAPGPIPEAPSPIPKPEAPSPILKPEVPSPIPEVSNPIPKAPSPVPEAPSPRPEATSPIPKPEAPSPIPKAEAPSPIPEPPSPIPEVPSPIPEPPSPIPEVSSPKPEAPSPISKPEAPGPIPEAPSHTSAVPVYQKLEFIGGTHISKSTLESKEEYKDSFPDWDIDDDIITDIAHELDKWENNLPLKSSTPHSLPPISTTDGKFVNELHVPALPAQNIHLSTRFGVHVNSFTSKDKFTDVHCVYTHTPSRTQYIAHVAPVTLLSHHSVNGSTPFIAQSRMASTFPRDIQKQPPSVSKSHSGPPSTNKLSSPLQLSTIPLHTSREFYPPSPAPIQTPSPTTIPDSLNNTKRVTPHGSITTPNPINSTGQFRTPSTTEWMKVKKTPLSSNQDTLVPINGGKVTPPLCNCGKRTKRKLVTSPGPNEGKPFYSCPLGRGSGGGKGCGFFKWEGTTNFSQQTSANFGLSCSCRSSPEILHSEYPE